MNKPLFPILPLALMTMLCTGGCHSHAEGEAHDHDHDAAEQHDHADGEHRDGEEEASHEGEIILTAEQARTAGVRTMKLEPSAFRSVMPVGGQLLADQSGEQTLVARQDGIVTFAAGLMTEGASIRAGESVATLSAKDFKDGDPAERARTEYELAKAEYERAQSLVGDRIISQREFLRIKADYENARLAYTSQAARRTAAGTQVTAPRGGYLKARLVAQGAFVTAGTPVAIVTQSRRLWLRADVPVSRIGLLPSVTSAHFRMAGSDRVYRLDDLHGQVQSFARSVSDGAAFVPMTFSLDNVGDLVAGAFAEVWLLTDEREGVLSVPVTALTEEQGAKCVYVRTAGEVYERRIVTTGQNDGTRIEVCSGLRAGDDVVVEGVSAVRLAAASTTIPSHNHNH